MFFKSRVVAPHQSKNSESTDADPREMVVLVHGLSAKRLMMWPLARHFRHCGYRVLNWGYRSSTRSVDWHAGRLASLLKGMDQGNKFDRVHVVAHSMGCIVTRAALEKNRLVRLGRVIMLAPPNHGSHAARILSPAVNWFCPTMKELSDAPGSFVNSLPTPYGYEFGVIAASRDRVIRQANTHLDGESDFTVVSSHHGVLPLHRRAKEQAASFLKTGRFLA